MGEHIIISNVCCHQWHINNRRKKRFRLKRHWCERCKKELYYLRIYVDSNKCIVCQEDRIVHWISGCGQTPWPIWMASATFATYNWYTEMITHAVQQQQHQQLKHHVFSNDFFTNRYQLRMNAPVCFIARPQRHGIVFNTIIFNEYPSAQNELQVHEKLFIFFLLFWCHFFEESRD